MKLNLFGSTGVIGKKTLKLIEKNFPTLTVNLLTANKSHKILYQQIIKHKPKYVFLNNFESSKKLKLLINRKKTKILNSKELSQYLLTSKSDLSLLAISGYKSLHFLEEIIDNTKLILIT